MVPTTEVTEPQVQGEDVAAVQEDTQVNTASAIADAVSRLMPGDIITLDGQKIVIPGMLDIAVSHHLLTNKNSSHVTAIVAEIC